jgi:hypothetical protein
MTSLMKNPLTILRTGSETLKRYVRSENGDTGGILLGACRRLLSQRWPSAEN